MSRYIEYDLGDGATILIETDEDSQGITQVSRDTDGIMKVKAKKNFIDALKDVKLQSQLLLKEIEALHVDEAEVKFGLSTIGEVGNIAIGKLGFGVNYEVTLRWKSNKNSNL